MLAALLLFCLALPAVAQVDLKVHPAPDFGEGVVWLDEGAVAPHHIADYRGKVVLVDFWEYTCINCIRDFGVVKRWYTKYHPYGFEVIGVHYGEFNIGFDVNNVKEARAALQAAVAGGRRSEGNDVEGVSGRWLARALPYRPERTDRDEGLRRGQQPADGDEDSRAAGGRTSRSDEDPARSGRRRVPARSAGTPTQETYVGEIYGRGSVEDMNGHHAGEEVDFRPPHSPADGAVELVGRWKIENDGVTSAGKGARAEVRYHARSMYAVLSLKGAKQVRVNLFQDGAPMPKDDAGADVKFDAKGAYLDVTEARAYYLVRSPRFTAHLISLEPEGPGLTLHSFTYGNNCQLQDKP